MALVLSLIPYWHPDPIIFRIGPLAIHWYGVAYLIGFLLAMPVLNRLARRGELRMPPDWVGDMVGWLAMGVILGGRTGWWLVYHRPVPGVVELWYEPFAIWNGGMSFHGGLIGVLLALLLWCRFRKLSVLNVADALALVTPIGLCLGRIANYINGELVGRPTNVPWAMAFPPDFIPRHPSQLYESFLEGPVLLGIVWLVKRIRSRREGEIAAVFVMGYAVLRFFVEFFRMPDEQLGYLAGSSWLTMGQVLSAIFGVVGLVWWIWLRVRKPPAAAPVPFSGPSTASSKAPVDRPTAT